MENHVRAALVGFGGMGQNYARMLFAGMVPGIQLTGVCCRNFSGQEVLKKDFPGVAIYQNTDAMALHATDFDAVIIVTPHTSHVPIGIQMANLGKHILMDKPAGIYADAVQQLISVCEENSVCFAMMFNNRRLPAWCTAHKFIQSGKLGTLHRAVWVCNDWYRSPAYHRSAAWRSSWNGECGGLLVNQNPHNLDLWNWLFGLPQRVYAAIEFGRYNNFCVDDAVDIQFSYDSGFHGTFVSATGEAPGVNRLEVWGSKGRLTVEDNMHVFFDENEVSTEHFCAENQEKFAAIPHAQHQLELEPPANPYPQMLENFAQHILTGTPLYADGLDGLKEVQLANAIYVSGWEERRIRIPVDPQLYRQELTKRQQEERK